MKPECEMPSDEEMKAFHEGELAFGRGATLDDNPYPKYDAENLPHDLYVMWLSGWTSGQVDAEAAVAK